MEDRSGSTISGMDRQVEHMVKGAADLGGRQARAGQELNSTAGQERRRSRKEKPCSRGAAERARSGKQQVGE